MITEDYVSFEVAKLLKEKGFKERTYGVYNSEGGFSTNNPDICWNEKDIPFISAPTHQMALKHLRKTYKVHFEILYRANRYEVFIMTIEELPRCICRGITGKTYEEAVEKALKYYLTNQI